MKKREKNYLQLVIMHFMNILMDSEKLCIGLKRKWKAMQNNIHKVIEEI